MQRNENRNGTAIRGHKAKLSLMVLAICATMLSATSCQSARLALTPKHGTEVKTIHVESRALHRTMRTTVVLPPAWERRQRRPLLVFLHGRSDRNMSAVSGAMLSAVSRQGRRAPVVAFPDGGDHSYWHNRSDGDWGDYVMRDVIPTVARKYNLDTQSVAIGGISMGGFGAMNFARQYPNRFCAVGSHSGALWSDAALTPEGAYDDAADFARNDVMGTAASDPARLSQQPLWIDAGDEDPFLPAHRQFVATLRANGVAITQHVWPGKHEGAYWNAHWNSYMRFYSRALRRCNRDGH